MDPANGLPGGASPPERAPASKRDAVYRYYKPARDFAYRLSLDGDTSTDGVNRAFLEILLDLEQSPSAEAFRNRLFGEAARFTVLARKGSHFSFQGGEDDDAAPPFSDRTVTSLTVEADFAEAMRRTDPAHRAVAGALLEGVPAPVLGRVLGVSTDHVLQRFGTALQELSWAFEAAHAPDPCGAYDTADFRRSLYGAQDDDVRADFEGHLAGGCEACRHGLEAVRQEHEVLVQAFRSIRVPNVSVQTGLQDVLQVPDAGPSLSGMGGGRPPLRISRELGAFLGLLLAAALVAALYGLTELFYGDNGSKEPSQGAKPEPAPPAPGSSSLRDLDTAALLANLSLRDPARIRASEAELVRRGPDVLDEVLKRAEGNPPRVAQIAQRVTVGIVRDLIKDAAARRPAPVAPAGAELDVLWQQHREGIEERADVVDDLYKHLSAMKEDPDTGPERMRLAAHLAMLYGRLSNDRALLKEDLADVLADRQKRLAEVSTHWEGAFLRGLTYDQALAWLDTRTVSLSWTAKSNALLALPVHTREGTVTPLQVLADLERDTGVLFVIDPALYATEVRPIRFTEKDSILRFLLTAMTRHLTWSWQLCRGCVLLWPGDRPPVTSVIDHFASMLDDGRLGPAAALELSRLLGVNLGLTPLEPLTSKRNASAFKAFRKWFSENRGKVEFDGEKGVYRVGR